MMCDCCQQPMKPEESEKREMPGATGAGITLHLHKRHCWMPDSARPRPYPYDRRH